MKAKKDPVNPVIGHHSAWRLSGSHKNIEPYKLTPGATDVMHVRVRQKLDILGVGIDVIQMEGVFVVRRDHPRPIKKGRTIKWGQAIIKTEFRTLELYGESPLFGTIRVRLDPAYFSGGDVGPADLNSLAAKCFGDVHPMIELPEMGLKLATGAKAVRLGSKVVQIPPVGDVARSENSAALKDENGNILGEIVSCDVEVGDVLQSIPLGETERRLR